MSLKAFAHFLSALCTPSSDYIKDPTERNLIALKVKAQLILYLVLLSLLVFQAINGTSPIQAQVVRICGFSFLLVSLVICCRSLLHIYYIIVTIYACFISIASAASGETFFSAGASFVGTIFLYVVTDNCYYYLTASAAYLFNLNYFLRPNIEANLNKMEPEDFSRRIVAAFSIQLVIMVCFLSPTHIAMKKLNTELRESQVEVEGSLSHYKTFLFSFSHEIRNPINILLGSIELALQEKLPNAALEMVETAKISSELLLQLINNVLDVGKAEVGKLEIVPTPTRVHDLLLRMWSISSELIKKKGLFGYLKVSTDLPHTLHIDPDRLNQVLLNLLGNAVKFTKKGVINLTVDWLSESRQVSDASFGPEPFEDTDEGVFCKNESFTTLAYSNGPDPGQLNQYYVLTHLHKKSNIRERIKTQTHISFDKNGSGYQKGVMRITVTDQGCGMSKEAMNGLFKKFYQCSNEASQRKRGTGLGLYITKDICEGMGGEIRVYSKEDVGSAFIVCIPTYEVEKPY